MRGSPLLRTFLILVLLLGSGVVIFRLTAKAEPTAISQPIAVQKSDLIPAKFHLTLSKMSDAVELKIGAESIKLATTDSIEFSGNGLIDLKNPVIFLKVTSGPQDPAGSVFAKLVVEADGKETFTHVFDARGDIDDFVELPF